MVEMLLSGTLVLYASTLGFLVLLTLGTGVLLLPFLVMDWCATWAIWDPSWLPPWRRTRTGGRCS